ncbi:MAG: PP2C family protein-serine/threonine phosphatase [bacterium]
MRIPFFQPPLPLPRYTYVLGSWKGKVRETNEDLCIVEDPASPYVKYRKGPLFIVTDGVGGHRCGAFASSLAIASIRDAYYKGPATETPADALERALQWASASIFYARQEKKECDNMASTAVALSIVQRYGFIAYVGDSRAYLFRKGFLTCLTTDHIREVITEKGEKRKVLERALGMERVTEVDVIRVTLEPMDRILLCSDGLTDEIPDENIEEILRQSPNIRTNMRSLVHLANLRGGHDNITLILVRIRSLPGK